MNRHNHADIQGRVRMILETVPQARASYDILYVEFMKEVAPEMVGMPFYIAMVNTNVPSYQSVARASRHIKKECEWLRETPENKRHRDEIEQSYIEEYGK